MSHQVLSRKYRPQSFDGLVGQDHVARILKNAIVAGRVGHAYLFVGPRGVGKTSTARIFARALNCPAPEAGASGEPCGECASCRDIASGTDLDVVEMDAASNNHVEDVRTLREQVGYATARSRFRIWIVDEVHMLSLPAFNAFLKTLEEPPAHVKFLFCTTEEHKLPDTFRSRCQRVEFRPIGEAEMAARLQGLAAKEGVEAEPEVLQEIAAGALGGLRDAESILEQLIAASEGGRIRREDLAALSGRAPRERLDALRRAVEAGDASAALDAVDACLASGSKPGVLLDQWLEALRADLVAAARSGAGVARLARAVEVLLGKRAHLKAGADGVLVAEVAAVELARLPDARDLDQLIAALRSPSPAAAAAPSPASPRGAPAPKPPGRAQEPGGSLDAARVLSSWDAFVAAAGRRDVRLGEALRRARPGPAAEGRLSLRVPRADAMARSTLERREMVLAFRHAAEEVLGLDLVPAVESVVEAVPAPTGGAATAALREHPLVQAVAEATGGRLLQAERTSPPAAAPGE